MKQIRVVIIVCWTSTKPSLGLYSRIVKSLDKRGCRSRRARSSITHFFECSAFAGCFMCILVAESFLLHRGRSEHVQLSRMLGVCVPDVGHNRARVRFPTSFLCSKFIVTVAQRLGDARRRRGIVAITRASRSSVSHSFVIA